MVNHSLTGLGASFAVISDATRRGVPERLGHSDASTAGLANELKRKEK